jgi:hypothetical protein
VRCSYTGTGCGSQRDAGKARLAGDCEARRAGQGRAGRDRQGRGGKAREVCRQGEVEGRTIEGGARRSRQAGKLRQADRTRGEVRRGQAGQGNAGRKAGRTK